MFSISIAFNTIYCVMTSTLNKQTHIYKFTYIYLSILTWDTFNVFTSFFHLKKWQCWLVNCSYSQIVGNLHPSHQPHLIHQEVISITPYILSHTYTPSSPPQSKTKSNQAQDHSYKVAKVIL